MKTEHILIIRFSAIGDVAMTVPVVYSLATQYPEVRITMLSRPFAKPLFENLAPNVGFMEADIKGEYHGIKGLNALYRRLIAKNFTAIADLHNVLRSDYLRLRFNLDQYKVAHINKHRSDRRKLIQQNSKVLEPIQSAFDNYAEVFSDLGYPITYNFNSLFTSEQASLQQLAPAIEEKKAFQQWIGIAPFAAHKGKAYPLNLMEKVIDGLVQRHPSCRIFLFGGGQKEKQQLEEVSKRHKNCSVVPSLLHNLHDELSAHARSRRDGVNGLGQHASGFARGHTRRKRLGSHTSLRWLHGMEPKDGQCRTVEHEMPSLLHLRQQTLPAWRLCLPDGHQA